MEPIIPDAVWCGHEGAEDMKVRIIDNRRDGRVVVERIAGAPERDLRRELTVTPEQLRAAFHPTDEWDFGGTL